MDHNRLSLRLTIDSKFKARLRQQQQQSPGEVMHSVTDLAEGESSLPGLKTEPRDEEETPSKVPVGSPVTSSPSSLRFYDSVLESSPCKVKVERLDSSAGSSCSSSSSPRSAPT